ncbi:arginine-glutamic acid dipeptide repeats protein-like [Thunnus maccoyii]|uniref:arginine-glutamic acid dipeptide repeats protein-like n=1 Tax=Thunnus maccoyii TaxID=8240 RepID=UPI001C4CE679|nr:arginine-glutamic acid dipeptide repeats protein-like [Thunnus maccoyii]
MTQIVKLVPSAHAPAPPPAVPPPSTPQDNASTFAAVPTSSTAAPSPETSSTSPVTPKTCPTCKRDNGNYLVDSGLIPPSLATILVTPTFDTTGRGGRWVPLQARDVTSDKYNAILQKLNAAEKKKQEMNKKRKEEQEIKREKRAKIEKKREEKEREILLLKTVSDHCAVCRNITPPGSEAEVDDWVQCELCELWFQLVCVDLSDAPDGEHTCVCATSMA